MNNVADRTIAKPIDPIQKRLTDYACELSYDGVSPEARHALKVRFIDTLGALVANLIEAEVLVLLTDQAGLYTADPRKDSAATLVRNARAGDPALEAMAGGVGSTLGKGGMLTKILAAKRAARSGASTVIASGREPNVLTRLAKGEAIGSELIATTFSLAARKQWLADHVQLAG